MLKKRKDEENVMTIMILYDKLFSGTKTDGQVE